jgi:SAM-dependent methyltransferase
LNAGSGGNDLGLCPDSTINLDISEVRVARLPNPVVASIETLPFANGTIDMILCVGSVVNYCDAAAAISEFGRVLRPSGQLVLEFESSRSAELLTQDAFGRTVAVAETFYADQKETVWVYSPEFVKNLLLGAKFAIVRRIPVHILSPWVLLITRSVPAAAVIARLDRYARYLPILSRWASNHLLFCQKRSA